MKPGGISCTFNLNLLPAAFFKKNFIIVFKLKALLHFLNKMTIIAIDTNPDPRSAKKTRQFNYRNETYKIKISYSTKNLWKIQKYEFDMLFFF